MAANNRETEVEPAIETAVASLPNEPVLSNSSGFANAQIALRERYNTLQQSLTSAREPDAGPTIVPAEHQDSNFMATDKSEASHTARIEIGGGPEIDAARERAELVARLQNGGRGPAERLREPFVRPPLSFSLQDDIIKNQ
jgi:hypothetical protein